MAESQRTSAPPSDEGRRHRRHDAGSSTPSSPPAPCPVKSLVQCGQLAKDVLYGNRTEGSYNTAGTSKLVISSTTSKGLSLSTTATSSGPGPVAGQLVATLIGGGAWLGDLLLTSAGLAEATLNRTFTLAPPSEENGKDSESDGSAGEDRRQPSAPIHLLSPTKVVLGCVVSVPVLMDKARAVPPKITMDLVGNYLHAKASATVAPKPVLTAAAVMGSGRVALGGEATFSSATRRMTRWSGAAAWHDTKQHIGLHIGNGDGSSGSSKATLLYGYSLDPGLALGLEAVTDVKPALAAFLPPPGEAPGGSGGGAATAADGSSVTEAGAAPKVALSPPIFSLGASFKLPSSKSEGGSRLTSSSGGDGTVKVKVSSRGVLSLLYRDTLMAGPRVTLTAELDGRDPGQGPRLGAQLEL